MTESLFPLAALRDQAEHAEPNTCPSQALLALVEVAEAARVVLERIEAKNPMWWDDADREGRLADALARFDFGGES